MAAKEVTVGSGGFVEAPDDALVPNIAVPPTNTDSATKGSDIRRVIRVCPPPRRRSKHSCFSVVLGLPLDEEFSTPDQAILNPQSGRRRVRGVSPFPIQKRCAMEQLPYGT